MLKLFLLSFLFVGVWCNASDFYERCLDGFTYRFRSDDVTLPILAKILTIAYPNALYVARQTDSVYVSLKEEQSLMDIKVALGTLNIKIEYVNLLITYSEFLEVKSQLDTYEIDYSHSGMEQFFNPTQCEVYIPPSEGGDLDNDILNKMSKSLESIDSSEKASSSFLEKIEKASQDSDSYLKSIEGIVKTTVGIVQTIKNIYQGSYQIYQFLTGASTTGSGEICPLPNSIMKVEPSLPYPDDYVEPSSLNIPPLQPSFNAPPSQIPPTSNTFGYMIELFANMSNGEAANIFGRMPRPEIWTRGKYNIDLFIGQGKNVFGINWSDEAKANWTEILSDPTRGMKLFVTLQNQQGTGSFGKPFEAAPGTYFHELMFSATSLYYPFKREFFLNYQCLPEPAKCSIYYQFMLDIDTIRLIYERAGIKCDVKK